MDYNLEQEQEQLAVRQDSGSNGDALEDDVGCLVVQPVVFEDKAPENNYLLKKDETNSVENLNKM